MYKYVLFDLDGTLTDSKDGIINSVAYALEKMGESTEGRLDQHTVVGPPLLTTFEEVYGFRRKRRAGLMPISRNATARSANSRTGLSTASFPC